MYLESFKLPIDVEDELLADRAQENGGPGGYIDNPYPCGLFAEKGFSEIGYKKITIFYGGNGSGKSTLLNLIAEKLKLNRIAPYNSGEMIASYVEHCEYSLGYDDEGFEYSNKLNRLFLFIWSHIHCNASIRIFDILHQKCDKAC